MKEKSQLKQQKYRDKLKIQQLNRQLGEQIPLIV